jgi:hypothetical protein
MSDIRRLLEHAADGGGPSLVTTESVYAEAARVRRRRRAVAGAAAAAVAVAVTAGVLTGRVGSPFRDGAEVAARPLTPPERAREFAVLLRLGGGGTVEPDGHTPVRVVPGTEPRQAPGEVRSSGPLDGTYVVSRQVRGGTVRNAVTVTLLDPAAVRAGTAGRGLPADLCARFRDASAECRREELPGGRVLTVWVAGDPPAAGRPWPSREYAYRGRLALPDGSVLIAEEAIDSMASAFTTGNGGVSSIDRQRTLLDRAGIRALLLSPELLPPHLGGKR